jgi:hypothetical protein
MGRKTKDKKTGRAGEKRREMLDSKVDKMTLDLDLDGPLSTVK